MLRTYGHLVEEYADAPPIDPKAEIRAARSEVITSASAACLRMEERTVRAFSSVPAPMPRAKVRPPCAKARDGQLGEPEPTEFPARCGRGTHLRSVRAGPS